ncbi:IMP dehydrogenase [Candidatus Vampirococcus lugosii]|uniref:Inosine 5'-monophosphate dehydrogenase n=1 Tax=Candidatus Vampirococcus lugosii TaxID=2789015 RepID=A0ABS5QKK1_9BACT|nr:IMP dehydrogenase [Candidatus Vampirococcus lugosii]MBS8121649.1 inosine 5'-monophosphate dehydrogenase [Candidatus Vampirococcus lugosii]
MKKREDKFNFPDDGTKLTFDDVFLLINEKSTIHSRRNIDLSVKIKNLKLNLPILGANMSTVMDGNFAKYLALMGGIGVIHQNYEIQEQIYQINKVKKYASPIISDPISISSDTIVKDIKNIFEEYSIGALIVSDNNNLKGIITKRDINSADSDNDCASDLMTKFDDLFYIESNDLNIDLEIGEKKLKKSKVEQLAILNSEKKLIGLFTKKGLDFYKTFPNSARDNFGRLVVAAALGINRDPIDRTSLLVSQGVDMIVFDTAHGYNDRFIKVLRKIRNNFPNILLTAGNIDNPKAAIEFAKEGADILKVGIGPGGACKTRIQTGFGKPQLSAIWEIRQALDKKGFNNVKIIADGGIKEAGNLAKAIAVGADFGMMGSIFAGTDKAVGQLRNIDGKLYKDYRGMASFKESLKANKLSGFQSNNYGPIFDEGADDIVPYKGDGSFFEIIRKFHGALASSLSYANSNNLKEFYEKTIFGKQTINGNIEGTPWKFG